MRPYTLALILVLAAFIGVSAAIDSNSLAQAPASGVPVKPGVLITRLSPPVYPPLARQTKIAGDVKLSLGIRPDGTVESATIVSGHPLLQRAALDSAQQSQFECGGCAEAVTLYSLIFTFQLTSAGCHAATNGSSKGAQQEGKTNPLVSQSQNQVTIIAEATCDPGVLTWKVRSFKCLYLWKCGWRT